MLKHIVGIVLFFPFIVFADDCENLPVSFSDTYAVTVSQDDRQLELYFTVQSSDPKRSQTITDVTTPNAQSMVSNNPIVIPPQGLFYFWPRNFHILFEGYQDRPNPGNTLSATFVFDNGCQKTVDHIAVKDPDDLT